MLMKDAVQDSNVALSVRIVLGLGWLKRIGQIAKNFGSKAFVTINPYLEGSGVADEVRSLLTKAGLAVFSFSIIKPNPVCFDVDQGAALCKEHGCEVVVAVGGGSAIDTSKAFAILAVNRGQAWNHIARTDREVLRPYISLPLVCGPATASSGAEVTLYSAISYTSNFEKFAALAEAFDENMRGPAYRTRAEKRGELVQRLFRDINGEIGFGDSGMT